MGHYQLMDENRNIYFSSEPGLFGGYRRKKIYGRLDCKSANRAIAKGGYVKYRVFFKDEETAIKAGYRPCAKCMPEKYSEWKKGQK
jgi:methylphosphotriester-DNA--protein-cysteine methyltransferase